MTQELRGSEFAKKRYMKYDFNVYWKKHALYFGFEIQRAYHRENNKPCALYRVVVAINPDDLLIIVADSLDNIKTETKGYKLMEKEGKE